MKKTAPTTSAPKKGKWSATRITPAKDAILREIATYYFLTPTQIARVRQVRSITRVWDLLRDLRTNGFVKPYRYPHTSPSGRPESVYVLDKNAFPYFAQEGRDISGYRRIAEEHEYSYIFLRHTLAVNDFLIAGRLLQTVAPEITLSSMRHERELKRESQTVTIRVKEGERWKELRRTVVPDGWVDFHIGEDERAPIVLELSLPFNQQQGEGEVG